MQNWLCVRTTTGKERVAEDRLRAFDIETFLPFTEHYYLDRFDNQRRRERALFPGYLFAYCERGQYSLAAMGWRKEILRLVGIGCEPQIVPQSIIDEITERIDSASGLVLLDDGFKVGQCVKIIAGTYEGQTGLFQRDEQKRVWVLIEMLHRQLPVPVMRSMIRPALVV